MIDILNEPIKIDKPSVDEDVVKVALLLDESTSMTGAAADTIKNLNSYLDEQASREKKVLVSVYTFSSETGLRERFRSVNAKEAPRLGLFSRDLDSQLIYQPNGMTPLYDAMGNLISRETDDVPTLVVILTDGHENASREFNKGQIIDLIKQKEEDGWTFVFLMADLSRDSAVQVASSLMGRNYEAATMTYSKGLENVAFDSLSASSAVWENAARTMRSAGIKGMGASVTQDFFSEGTRDIKKPAKAEVKKD